MLCSGRPPRAGSLHIHGGGEVEKEEILDILLSVLILAFIFSYSGPSNIKALVSTIPYSLASVSVAFVFHELAHRQVARKLGFFARYEMWPIGALLSFLASVASNGAIGFAALGAVMIYPKIDLWGRFRRITPKENMLISIAGPAANVAVAGVSLLAFHFSGFFLFRQIYSINVWLAFFNMLPVPPLDGSKVFSYSWKLWLAVFIPLFGLTLFL